MSGATGPSEEARAVAACAWCGGPIAAGDERTAAGAVCPRCASATTEPVPSETELELAYTSWYRPQSGRFSGAGDALLGRTRGLLASRLDRIAPPGAILDVGSGDGTLLAALRAQGREAVGVERAAQSEHVISTDVREIERGFAGVVFWHSLEHLRDAGEVIGHAAGLLEPGGVLVVAMPNPASIQARLFADRWLALDLPRHLVHVPASALHRRLGDLGLSVERTSYARGGQVVFGWLHGLVGSLPGNPDLYDAIRRPQARRRPISRRRRAATLAAGVALAPVAAVAAVVEVALRRGGTTYVEARRSSSGHLIHLA